MKNFSLSIIIPIGPGDQFWPPLLEDLKTIFRNKLVPFQADIILCYCKEDEEVFLKELNSFKREETLTIKPVASNRGRSIQQNKGAENAEGDFLWFLHADSKIEASTLIKLYQSIIDEPNALHYFNLAFLADGPFLIFLNEWGARLRSEVFKMPFGDQGFCIKRETFWLLGGFLVGGEKKGGEDHLFVWEIRKKGFRLRNTGGQLVTSARKYSKNGWLKTTAYHIYLTYKVAFRKYFGFSEL
ncbi:MAG: glycosyltransferase [Bdellovibrionota bacterium]|nr:glycosyltransferase [Bdellovibrionota bacterium]